MIPLLIAILAVLPRRPVMLYRAGAPTPSEVIAYENSHRGWYPSLPSPITADYVLRDEKGLSLFHQSATITHPHHAFEGATPGRFEMIFYPRIGLSTISEYEPIDLRSAGERSLGFVWRNVSTTSHGATFTCRQITIPRWFIVVFGVTPTLAVSFRTITRRLRFRRFRRRHLCPACGYDLRATPDRCPECGTKPQ
jgi:hypothetical protein